MTKLEKVKAGLRIATTIGTGMIISNLVAGTTPKDTKTLTRIVIALGSGAIAGLVGAKVGTYVDETFDETVEALQER